MRGINEPASLNACSIGTASRELSGNSEPVRAPARDCRAAKATAWRFGRQSVGVAGSIPRPRLRSYVHAVSAFDFVAFRDALVARDVDRWLSFYAPDAEWLEYRNANPPRAPNAMRGIDEIGRFMREVAASPIKLTIENEVVADQRAAFTLTVPFDDGRRIIENIIIEHRNGKVVREIDVEAWD